MPEPIDAAIRRLTREIAEIEWAGGDARPQRLALGSLIAAKARGEAWAVPF